MNKLTNLVFDNSTIDLVSALGWALVHFLWQAAVVALMVAAALALMAKFSAGARYLVACIGLLLMAICPLLTCGYLLLKTVNPPLQTAMDTQYTSAVEFPEKTANEPNQSIGFSQTDLQSIQAEQGQRVTIAKSGMTAADTAAVPTKDIISLSSIQNRFQLVLPSVVVAWLAGVVLLSLRLLVTWVRVQKLKLTGTPLTKNTANQLLERLADRIGLKQPVEILQSAVVKVPTQMPSVHMSGDVQGLPSTHGILFGVPVQVPRTHTSSSVQELPSSQGTVFGVKTHSP